MLHRFFISLIFVYHAFSLSALSFSVLPGKYSTNISYLVDTTHSITIEEVDLIPNAYFLKADNGSLKLGREESPVWIRIDILFDEKPQEDYLLELDYSLVDYIDYYFKKGQAWSVIKTGSQRRFTSRYLDYRFFIFPLTNTEKVQTVYFKINSKNTINFGISLKNTKDFYTSSLNKEIGHGLFIGFLILVMLTNLIFFFALKDRSFLIYVGYMFFTLCINLVLTGHASKYLPHNYGGFQNQFFILVFAFTISLSIWFAYEFLNLKEEKRLLKFLLILTAVVAPIMGLVSLFDGYVIVNSIFELLTLILLLVIIAIGIKRWKQGHKFAGFYVVAYLAYLTFITPIILLSFNLVERNFFSVYGSQIGVVLESFLLAVALGYRYSSERQKADREKKVVLEENLHLQKQLHSKLEQQVQERTAELNNALTQLHEQKEEIERQKENIEEQNKQLEKMNDNKSRFISILAHDVKGPINSLFSFAELLKNHIDHLSRKELVELGEKLGSHTKNLFNLLENLLQWSRAETGRIDVKPVCIELNEAIRENIELSEMSASNKQISFKYTEVPYTIFSDKDMFNTVLRNLLANAVKFSFEKSEITVSAEKLKGEVILKVKDNGVGIPPKVQDRLFDISTKHSTSGTSGEKGTGLGLKLCKEFVNLNGGQIWVESKYAEGSSFYFTVPLATEEEKLSKASVNC